MRGTGFARRWLWVWLVSAAVPGPLWGQVQDSYEDLTVSWRIADHDCGLRLLKHERDLGQSHSGQVSEHVQFQAGAGTYAHLVSPLAASRVIDELTISVWVKANRPGLRLTARAVLPRSTDPRTGKPLSTLIAGTMYEQPETWQKLTVALPAELLQRQIPLLRSQFGSDVSPREAYLDLLVLNAYGGEGATELWLDDLEVRGQVLAEQLGQESPAAARATTVPMVLDTSKAAAVPQLKGSVLMMDDRPQLLRCVDHHGEPMAWLKSLGFNALRTTTPVTPEQLREAEECGMWLVVPPPQNHAPQEYGTALNRILAWDLGGQLTPGDVEPMRRRAEQLRSVPAESKRPVIGVPSGATWQYSRILDLVVLAPPGPQTSLPLSDFGEWYLEQARLLRLGSHFWACVQTQIFG